MVDPHTIATFTFAHLRRDPRFRKKFPWVHHTVICVDSDRVTDVLSGQMRLHFPEGGTIACYFPEEHRFVFVRVGAYGQARGGEGVPGWSYTDDGRLVIDDKGATVTMGEVVKFIYDESRRSSAGLPKSERQTGSTSTREAERALALT